MQIFCLSKLSITSQRKKLDDKYRYLYFENRQRHRELVKERVLQKELENCENYAYTEIRIGKIDEIFYFVLFRNNTLIVAFPLKKDTLKIFPKRDAADSKVIEIEVKDKIFVNRILKTDCIEKITLRCVKVFKRGVKGNAIEIQKSFKDYANEINKQAAEFKDMDLTNAQEKSFEKLKSLRIPSESPGALSQKIIDLYDAITDLCHEGKVGTDITNEAKYNTGISVEIDIVFDKRKIYHARDEKTKDFSTCNSLRYDNIAIWQMNPRWFDAPAMTCLTFKKCPIFKTEIKCQKTGKITKIKGSWTFFEENVSKLTNLHILEIMDCELKEIPETLFSKLPSKLDSLIFDGNLLTEISSEIEHVKNLKYLSVNGNPNLSSEGVPWNSIPEMIEVFRFVGTNISEIPLEARRLKNLKFLDAKVHQFQEGNVDSLVKEFGHISIKNTTVTTNISTKGYAKFVLTYSNLKDISMLEIDESTGNLNLSYNNMASFILQPKDHNYLHLRHLDLSNNNLTSPSISWGVLPQGLTHLDLSFNKLTEFGPVNHLKSLTTLRLQNNQLTFMAADIFQAQFLLILNLRNNQIQKLEEGFEFKKFKFNILDLSNNAFKFKNKNLKENLWDRLPKSGNLLLNNNALVELPCQLKGKFENLHVMGCELEYICPQIYASADSFNINVANNPKLKLSFVPKHVYLPPSADEPETDRFDDAPEGDERDLYDDCVILSDNRDLRNTSKYVKASKNATLIEIDVEYNCKCCAMCEESDESFKIIEQIMVPDYRISLEKLENIKDDYYSIGTCFDNFGWYHGKWKTIIRARVCDPCREILRQRTDKQYEDYTADVNKKNKMKRLKINETSEPLHGNPDMPENHQTFEKCVNIPPIEAAIFEYQIYESANVTQSDQNGATSFYNTYSDQTNDAIINYTNINETSNTIVPSNLLLSNEYAVDCFLNVAVNAIASMESFATSICANVTFAEFGSTHHKLVEVLRHQVTHVRELRTTLPAFHGNQQEDAGEAFFRLINTIDNESKKLINFSYKSIFECPCRGAPIIQECHECSILYLTVTPNTLNTLNSMLEQWQSQNIQCSNCNGIATMKYPVEFGAEQEYLIIEINSWIRQQNSNMQISISKEGFLPEMQEIFGDCWDLIGAIQYIGTGEFGHYLWWKKLNGIKWAVVDGDKEWSEENMLPDLKHYKILIFKKLDLSDINMEEITENDVNGAIDIANTVVSYDHEISVNSIAASLPPLKNFDCLNQNFLQMPTVVQTQNIVHQNVPTVLNNNSDYVYLPNYEQFVVDAENVNEQHVHEMTSQTQMNQNAFSVEQIPQQFQNNDMSHQHSNIYLQQLPIDANPNTDYSQFYPVQKNDLPAQNVTPFQGQPILHISSNPSYPNFYVSQVLPPLNNTQTTSTLNNSKTNTDENDQISKN